MDIAAFVMVVAVLYAIRTLLRQLLRPAMRLLSRAARLPRPAQSLGGVLSTYVRDRSPCLHRFLRARLRRDCFAGLPLTLIVIAMAYLLALFAGLVEELFESTEIAAFDSAVSDALDPLRNVTSILVFTWITTLGDSGALVSAVAATTGLLWAGSRSYVILPLWLTVVGSLTTTWLGKYALYRPRPEFITDVTAFSPSFPSGHATGATAVYGFIAYIIVRGRQRMEERFEVAYWAAILALTIGFSRVFLGVHYASDVVAGWLVGLFWLLAGVAVTEQRLRSKLRGMG